MPHTHTHTHTEEVMIVKQIFYYSEAFLNDLIVFSPKMSQK